MSSFCLPALSAIFHSKNSLHNTSVFSSLLTAYLYLTGHSPVFIYNTALLYKILVALCGHLQTQRVCRALHPVLGEDGILVAEVPHGVQHASLARTSPRWVVGLTCFALISIRSQRLGVNQGIEVNFILFLSPEYIVF